LNEVTDPLFYRFAQEESKADRSSPAAPQDDIIGLRAWLEKVRPAGTPPWKLSCDSVILKEVKDLLFCLSLQSP
jgi:hypothetical protein